MAVSGWLPSLGRILAELRQTPLRFPLPLACALGFSLVSVADHHYSAPWQYLLLAIFSSGLNDQELLIFFFLGFFATLAASLFAEGRMLSRAWGIGLGLGALAPLALRVTTAPAGPDVWIEGYVLFLGPALVLLAMAAPFIARRSSLDAFWNFNRGAWLGAAFAFLVSLVVAIGLSLALEAIKTLFGVRVPGRYYEDIWVFSLALLWPWQALAAMPQGHEVPAAPSCPRLLAFLIGNILVPLALVYLVILYAYGAKILVDWALPQGQVASLAAVYATFGVAVHLAAYPLRKTGNLMVRQFYRWFYPALALPVVLLGLATWVRVEAYGFTEQRYLLAVFAVWLAAMTLWYWRTAGKGLVLIPLSLALLLGLGSFGPWGAFSISTASQLARLEALLTKHSILLDGRIMRAAANIDWQEQRTISSIVDYLSSSGKGEALRPWFEAGGLGFERAASGAALIERMGLTYVARWQTEPVFTFQEGREMPHLDVAGFDTLLDWSDWHSGRRSDAGQTAGGRFEVELDQEMSSLTVTGPENQKLVFDLAALVDRLRARDIDADLSALMTLEQAQAGFRVRLHVLEIMGQTPADMARINSLRAFILVGREPS